MFHVNLLLFDAFSMSSQYGRKIFSVIFLLIVFQLVEISATLNYMRVQCSDKAGAFTGPSGYNTTISPLLDKLYNKTSSVSFYAAASGVIPDTVFGLFLCRPDLSLQICKECIKNATLKLVVECSDRSEAIVWYQECMLRYAKRQILTVLQVTPGYTKWSTDKFSDYENFGVVLENTTDSLFYEAALSTSYGHFATKEAMFNSHKLYFLAQCTPDISMYECSRCLDYAFLEMKHCCSAKTRVAVFKPSCQLRYDTKLFYKTTLVSPPFLKKSRPGTKLGRKHIIGIVSASAVVVALLVLFIWRSLRRKQARKTTEDRVKAALNAKNDDETNDIRSMESLQFDFSIIKDVTNNFSGENKLGKGGFGEVYKGRLGNGQEIAVKRLSKNSKQGILEFKNEVLLVAKLQHRNLVRLLGFCTSKEERILIYEFLTNSSLDHFLFGRGKCTGLDWNIRFKIITGIARGLLYLHEDSRLKIIHRDLKCSNILLDEAMNAKISDFGLARLFDVDQTQGDTKKIAGTYGYMAPEYAMAGQFSVKSDVYSFGVIILEIVSGQRNNFFHREPDEEALLHRAWRLWSDGLIFEVVDPVLDNNYSVEEVKMCIHIGLLCIQEDPVQRPRMPFVVMTLNGQSITLPLPNPPHLFSTTCVVTGEDLGDHDSHIADDIQECEVIHSNKAHTGPTSNTELCPR